MGLLDRSSSLKKNIDRLSDQYIRLTTFENMNIRVGPEQETKETNFFPKSIESLSKRKSTHLERRHTHFQSKDSLKKGHSSLPAPNKPSLQDTYNSHLQRALSTATTENRSPMSPTSVFPVGSLSTSFRASERNASISRSTRSSLRFVHKDSMDILNAHLFKDEKGRWSSDSLKEKAIFGSRPAHYPLLSTVFNNPSPKTLSKQSMNLSFPFNQNAPPSSIHPLRPSAGSYDYPISHLAVSNKPPISVKTAVGGPMSTALANTVLSDSPHTAPTQKKVKGIKGFLTRNLPGKNNKLFGILNHSSDSPHN
ncbi:hypothetical protein BDF14DRAFT_1777668 [Spinellus fusiger]|nr:hypothetical protein BDF14DRAFT_1777668 [Spinellus fusiger]